MIFRTSDVKKSERERLTIKGSSLFGVGGNDFHTGSLRSSFPAMR